MAKRETGKTLVIVESPAKAKTINKYLGDNYIVKASMGHVRDLSDGGDEKTGVNLSTFEPEYEVISERGKEKLVKELKALAKGSADVYLATDLDREGEAIAWHLKEALGIPDAQAKRVIFNAITKKDIQAALVDRANADSARFLAGDQLAGFQDCDVLPNGCLGDASRLGQNGDGRGRLGEKTEHGTSCPVAERIKYLIGLRSPFTVCHCVDSSLPRLAKSASQPILRISGPSDPSKKAA